MKSIFSSAAQVFSKLRREHSRLISEVHLETESCKDHFINFMITAHHFAHDWKSHYPQLHQEFKNLDEQLTIAGLITNRFKHSGRKDRKDKVLNEITQESPSRWGEAVWGEDRWGALGHIYITYTDGSKQHYANVANAVMTILRDFADTYLPELWEKSTFAPSPRKLEQ